MFKKAERKRAYLKIAATGPSGSGKTLSALLVASGLGKKIAVLDTENGSASLYSNQVDFDVVEIGAPFTTEKYIETIKAAEKAGYDVLVIDSLTHAWAGEGGLLQQKENHDARGGNSFANWAKITPKDNALRSAILQAKLHVITTMRSKQDTVLVEKNGKQVPQKVGLTPVQREGIEYEFTTVFDIAMNHQAQVSKDRTGLFDGNIFQLSQETGKQLLEWLNGAKEPDPEPAKESDSSIEQSSNGSAGDCRLESGQFEGKTIAEVVERVGLPKAQDYGNWLKQNRKGTVLQSSYCVNLERYAKELAASHGGDEPLFDSEFTPEMEAEAQALEAELHRKVSE